MHIPCTCSVTEICGKSHAEGCPKYQRYRYHLKRREKARKVKYHANGATAYTTEKEAIAEAKRQARKAKETRFVIREDGHLHVASNHDLETFWQGIRDNSILFATE